VGVRRVVVHDLHTTQGKRQPRLLLLLLLLLLLRLVLLTAGRGVELCRDGGKDGPDGLHFVRRVEFEHHQREVELVAAPEDGPVQASGLTEDAGHFVVTVGHVDYTMNTTTNPSLQTTPQSLPSPARSYFFPPTHPQPTNQPTKPNAPPCTPRL
jgi:hypothetical protein